MCADRARITYDPTKKYREVVSQQGRVTLESDWNEAQRIGTEEASHHALDFVGTCGTPDDGYEVKVKESGATIPSPQGPHEGSTAEKRPDFTISEGTMYVGGLRMRLEKKVSFLAQAEWLDMPKWEAPKKVDKEIPNAAIVLLCREQEITAVEDPALRDVALGGPDTAARTKILQRVVLVGTEAIACSGAVNDIDEFWSELGLELARFQRGSVILPKQEPAKLESRSLLEVTLNEEGPSTSPCEPPAQAGYLGADNQLIRVQIGDYDAKTKKGKLLWGYNNASTLFRCKALDQKTVELETRPVSPEHTPTTSQAVQVLMSTAKLGDGAYAAALTGHVATLAAPYDPDTRRVTLSSAMPSIYMKPPSDSPLFLRLWNRVLDFTLGEKVELPGAGLSVTISSTQPNPKDGHSHVHVGDYWCIAVRPLTPNKVYPERFLTAPQPPDGPRQWTCPLAILKKTANGWDKLEDCRRHFDGLVELTARKSEDPGCCCIVVKQEQAGVLQGIIDNAKGKVVRLEPGTYELTAPLEIGESHDGLVLESCTGSGVILSAKDDGDPSKFRLGLIQMKNVGRVTLRGLDFDTQPVGIQIASGDSVTLDQCQFKHMASSSIGVGVLGRGHIKSLDMCRCSVIGTGQQRRDMLSGLVIVPFRQNDTVHLPVIDSLVLEDNTFEDLGWGMLIAGRPGCVKASANVMNSCIMPFTLLSLPTGFHSLEGREVPIPSQDGSEVKDAIGQVNKFNEKIVGEKALLSRLLEMAGGFGFPKEWMPPASDLHVSMVLDLCGNQFDSRPPESQDNSGPAVYIWDLDDLSISAANISQNMLWNESSCTPTMMVLMVDRFNITGNVLANANNGNFGYDVKQWEPGEARFALMVVPGGRVQAKVYGNGSTNVNLFTVTGNTMTGRSNLGYWLRKEWSSVVSSVPLLVQTWCFFNTEV